MEKPLERLRKIKGATIIKHGEIGTAVKFELGRKGLLKPTRNRFAVVIPRDRFKEIGDENILKLFRGHEEVFHIAVNPTEVTFGLEKGKLTKEFVEKLERVLE
ncbi:MAG: hypothetical protein J7L23_02320 [Candidatus Diapherotrites archaeon]|nr:hypothetical protein [Candidatus Diapherotrites archaeon]